MRKIFTFLLLLCTSFSFAQSTTIVISQVYGAGGNSGSLFNADYVELHNISTAAVSLSGYSIQYASATSTTAWTGVSPLPAAASIPAGGYYLIKMSSTGTTGATLPTPDYNSLPTIAMSASSGKVAIVNGLTALASCTASGIIDLVGYGTANCSEAAAAPLLDTFHAAFRNNNGCAETNNNAADFTAATPAPRNSATAVSICTTSTLPALNAGSVVDFGNVVILTNSSSQTFNLSGTNLTGAPGNITINSPSADFQVSLNNTTWSASVSLPYTTATLAPTPVYVRFTPQSVGPKSGNVNIFGGGVATAINVAVSGNGIIANAATVSATALATFGGVCINTTGGPNSFDITGTNLTAADLTIGPLAGYTFSTTSGGTYSSSLTLTHPAGTYNQTVFVQFLPTAVASYNGNIPVNGGGLGSAANVPVTGSGTAGTATVTTGAANSVTMVSATLSGSLPSQGCSPVTAWGFEYSLVSGFINGTVAASSSLSGIDFTASIAGLTPGTTYYYKAFATNAGGTVYGIEMSFITAAAPASTLSASALAEFGSTCAGTTVGPNSFDVTGVNLTTAPITVGPLNGFTFSTSAGGTYTSSLTLSQSGGAYSQTIYVKFAPVTNGIYDGNIPVSGGGVSSFTVAATASANNSGPVILTNDATSITFSSAVANASLTGSGCSTAETYGIEYSGINGFIEGSGMKVASANLTGTEFSSKLTGLVPLTTYFYKAYASNSGGTTYGEQRSFTTLGLPNGLIIYSTPIIRGQNLHYSLNDIKLKPGHYAARIHNSIGQLVYQKDIIIQVNFVNDNFIFPSYLPMGMYNLEIKNYEFRVERSFLVQ